ncbi:MAG: hypothetical protein JJU37_10230 [Balneolaceae bacterium]|nr:hypothetical protein [Balneolaceae bacterium]
MKALGKNYVEGLIAVIFTTGSLLIWHGCSDSTGSAPDEEITAELSCDDLSLAVDTAEAVSAISVSGVSAGLGEEPLVWVYDANDEDTRVAAYLERLDGEDAELTIPVHPGNWREGGAVNIIVLNEDGDAACYPLPLYIEALEPSTTTVEEVITDLELSLHALTESYGYNVEDLKQGDIFDVEFHHIGLASFIQALDGKNNPNSIRAILEGEASAFQDVEGDTDSPEFMELMNAIMQQAGLFTLLEEFSQSFEEHAQYLDEIGYSKKFPIEKSKSNNLQFDNDAHQSLTPSELSILLEDQSFYKDLERSFLGTAIDGTALVLGSISAVAGIFGLAPASLYTGIGANLFSTMGLFIAVKTSILPSELQEIKLEAEPLIYNEDQEDIGKWTATLEAYSSSWTLTWPDLIGVIPIIGPPAKAIDRFGKMIPGVDDLTINVLKAAQSYFIEVWSITAESGPYTIPERVYEIEGGINPDRDGEEEYFRWELIRIEGEMEDDAFTLGTDQTRYYPVAVGKSELRISTRPGTFADNIRVANTELEVKPITVEISSRPIDGVSFYSGPPFYIPLGEDGLPLMVNVSNSENPDITWELTGDGNLVVFGNEKTDADYILPDETTVDLVVVRAEGTGGARNHPNAPNRSVSARIYVVESPLFITPNPRCVQIDQTVNFEAIFEGEEISFSDLTWDIDGPGTLSSDGTYQSSTEGEVTIEFWLTEQRSFNYTIEFEVKSLCSYMRATGTGQWEPTRTVAFEYTTPTMFDYESTCISLTPYEPDDWVREMIFGNNAWVMSFSNEDNFTHELFLHKSLIEDEGDWEIELEYTSDQSFSNSLYRIFFLDDLRVTDSHWGGIKTTTLPLQLKREMMVIDGEEVPVFSGNYYNERLAPHSPGGGMPYLKVKFEGVVPGEKGCF